MTDENGSCSVACVCLLPVSPTGLADGFGRERWFALPWLMVVGPRIHPEVRWVPGSLVAIRRARLGVIGLDD